MEKTKTTPKDFFLWAGAMVAFYWSVIASILLIFEYINYVFPNALDYYPSNPYDSGIPYEMASIIVLFPLYFLLARIIRKDALRDPSRNELWVRRWALILTLFVAGVAIAVDLITILTTFLSGQELTTAFLLKALVVVLVAAGVFMHFIADLKGYWHTYPARKQYVGIAVGILALAIVGSGFFIVGTPQQARLERFDTEKVNSLQVLQSQVVYYWQVKRVLPVKLTNVSESTVTGTMPIYDAQTGAPYEYLVTGPLSFKLCATFNAPSRVAVGLVNETREVQPIKGSGAIDNWDHAAGRVCFDRTIDPSYYPPLQIGG